MAWRAEVIADNSGKWAGNALVFKTEEEAKLYVCDLSMRWMLVRETRVVETDEPVNSAIERNEVTGVLEQRTIKGPVLAAE